MKALDRLFEGMGYYKSPRIAEIIETVRDQFGLFDTLTDDDNVRKFLKAYNSEVYIYACVYRIATTLAGVKFKVYKDKVVKGEVIPQEMPEHPLQALINNPNPIGSDFDFKEATSTYLELTGDSYWLLDEMTAGKPKNMFVLMSDQIKIVPDPLTYVKGYTYGIANTKNPINLRPDQILHIKYFKPTSMYYGLSSVNPIKKEADTYRNAIISNDKIFTKGMQKDFVLSTKERLHKDVYERMKAQLEQKNRGVNKAHGPMILEQGMEAKDVSLSPKELEFDKGIRLLREAECSSFGVPPAMVGLLEYANYSNMEEQRKIFWQDTMIPKVFKLDAGYTKLARRWDDIPQFNGAYVKADLSNVKALKDDETIKSVTAKTYHGMGAPYNTIAKNLDLPIKDIPGGDVGYLAFNLAPVGSTEEAPKPTPSPTPPEEEEGKTIEKFTDTQKDNIWGEFVKSTESQENKYKPVLAKFFSDQESEVLANLNKFKNINYEQIMQGVFRFYETEKVTVYNSETKKEEPRVVKRDIDIDSVLFDEKENIVKYSKNGKKVYTNAIDESGKAEFTRYSFPGSFDITNPRVASWVASSSLSNAREVNKTVKDKLRKTLIAGVNEGEGIPELSKRIKGVYEHYGIDGSGVEKIARTEIIAASNEGAIESYEQSGVVEKKEWIATRDDRVRDGHLAADGQQVKLTNDFTVEGESLNAPGDPKGSAGNIINCRCTVAPVVKE